MLGQCASLAHLDLSGNGIGAEGAGRLVAVLGQCASFSQKNKATAQTRCDQVYSQVLALMYRISCVPQLPTELREQEMQDIQQIIDKLSLETDDLSLHAHSFIWITTGTGSEMKGRGGLRRF